MTPSAFTLWYDSTTLTAPSRFVAVDALGDTINVWIIDVDGTIVWIDGSTCSNATPSCERSVRRIVDSIQFE